MLSKVEQNMKIKRYSASTIKTYLACLKVYFEAFEGQNLNDLTTDQVHNYLLSIVEKGYALSTQNQHINAIKYYNEKILGKKPKNYIIERPRKQLKLPTVLSIQETQDLINSIQNIKHKAIVSITYGAG